MNPGSGAAKGLVSHGVKVVYTARWGGFRGILEEEMERVGASTQRRRIRARRDPVVRYLNDLSMEAAAPLEGLLLLA